MIQEKLIILYLYANYRLYIFLALSLRFKSTLVDLANTKHKFFIANRERFEWIGIGGVGEITKRLVFIGDINRLGGNT
jgi:hypothetical protein